MVSLPKTVITILADVDLTLTPDFMQGPLFKHYNHDSTKFWDENDAVYKLMKEGFDDESNFPEELRMNKLQQYAGICRELVYTQNLLDHVKHGCEHGDPWADLSRQKLRELGQEIEFYPGLPDAIEETKQYVLDDPEWRKHDIKLEWYAVSMGIADMIRGSKIGKQLDGIFASEFYPKPDENPATGTIDRVVFPVTHTEKTRFVHCVNKGPDYDVNAKVPPELRRVPGENMLGLIDGQSDVPLSASIRHTGGRVLGVYSEQRKGAYGTAHTLLKQGRVFLIAPANYESGSPLRRGIEMKIQEDAERIMKQKHDAIRKMTGKAPTINIGSSGVKG